MGTIRPLTEDIHGRGSFSDSACVAVLAAKVRPGSIDASRSLWMSWLPGPHKYVNNGPQPLSIAAVKLRTSYLPEACSVFFSRWSLHGAYILRIHVVWGFRKCRD